jgi:hypothetical protein
MQITKSLVEFYRLRDKGEFADITVDAVVGATSGLAITGYEVLGAQGNVLIEIINVPTVARYKRVY